MSKKIAQLTKVIYYLNSKQEDHAFEVQSINSVYEEEIESIITDANKKLADLHAKVTTTDANMLVYEDTIKSQLERISRHERDLENERERSEKLERRYDMDVSLLQSQVDTLSSESTHLQSRVDSLLITEKKLAELEVFHAKTIVEMEEAKKKALEELAAVKDKHFELQQEVWEKEKGKMEDQLRGEITGLEKKIDEIHETHTAETNALNLQHDTTVMTLKSTHSTTVSRLENNLTAAHERLEMAEQNISIQSTNLSRMQQQIEDLNETVGEERNRCAGLEGMVKKLESEAEQKVEEMDEMRKNMDDQTILIRTNETTITSLKTSLANSTAKLDSLLAAYSTLQQTHTETLGDMDRLKDEIDKLKVKEAELLEARKYVGKLERELERARMHSNEALNERQSEIETRIKEEIDIARGEFQIKLDQQIVLEKALARKEVIAEIEGLNETIAKLKTDVATANARTEEITKQLTRDIQTVQEELENRIRQGEAEIASLKRKLDETLRASEAREADYQATDKIIRDLKTDIESLEIDKADMIQKMMTLDSMIKDEMRAEAAREREELDRAWKKRVADELERLKKELIEDHRVAMENLRQQLEQEHERVIKSLQEVQSQERQQWDDLRVSMVTKLAEWESQHGETLETMNVLREQHTVEVEQLTSDFTTELARACTDWSLDSTARETQLRAESALNLAALQQRHANDILKLRQSHAKQLDELRMQHADSIDAAINELEGKRFKEIVALNKEHEQQMEAAREAAARKEAETVLQLNVQKMLEVKDAREELGKQLREREEEIEKLRTTELDYVSKNAELTDAIADHEATIQDLEGAVASHTSQVEAIKADLEAKMHETESAVDKRHKEELSKIHADHLKGAQAMLKEFEKAQAFLRKKITELEKSLEDAGLKYINRESREDDVKRIAELEEELKRRKRAITTLKEEIEHYKLELNNREANFNRIFNARPVVGVFPSTDAQFRKGLRPNNSSRSEPSLQTPRLPPLYGSAGASMELH
ncbi:hypothetical protein HDU93_009701 [Gonapodya sp. JEL0774]|nr:hypothetical protein HDU93_009701 [Gonapodya sp. JEL0774]